MLKFKKIAKEGNNMKIETFGNKEHPKILLLHPMLTGSDFFEKCIMILTFRSNSSLTSKVGDELRPILPLDK